MLNRISSSSGYRFRQFRKDVRKMRAERWVARGKRHFLKGEFDETLECCRRALSICDNLSSAYHLMTDVIMPGDVYTDLLKLFHETLSVKTYAEIGVREGTSLALAKPDAGAIGIDPWPRINSKIKARTKLFPITSDQFFESYDLLAELNTVRLDLAFVDGLHRFEQVLKDFINIERYSDPETIVLVHDCLPVARLTATSEQITDFWCGDVWKIIPCLREYRPDLIVGVIPTRPSGLGVITNLDPGASILRDSFNEIVERYQDKKLNYNYLDLGENNVLAMVSNLLPNDWPQLAKIFPTRMPAAHPADLASDAVMVTSK